MAREAAKDMELTCDAAVVAGADALARRAYSETLPVQTFYQFLRR